MQELRFLQVFKTTHTQAKEQAKKAGLSIRAYIQKLLDGDNKK